MNKTNYEMVREFHDKFSHPTPATGLGPVVLDPDLMALRVRLITEETTEFVAAALAGDYVGMADALTDLLYVTYGAAIALGIDADQTFREVHRSNLSKLDRDGLPIKRADGKVLKGPLYSPPNLRPILYGEETEWNICGR